jgi:hypothetical protein
VARDVIQRVGFLRLPSCLEAVTTSVPANPKRFGLLDASKKTVSASSRSHVHRSSNYYEISSLYNLLAAVNVIIYHLLETFNVRMEEIKI